MPFIANCTSTHRLSSPPSPTIDHLTTPICGKCIIRFISISRTKQTVGFQTHHLHSIECVSESLRNDLRHQIWNDLLRFGHSNPCLEKHLIHSMKSTYCCFSGRVSRTWPIASSSTFILSPFRHLCSHPKSDSMGPNHNWKILDLASGPHWSFLVPIVMNRSAETRLSSYLTIGEVTSWNFANASWFAHNETKSSAICRSRRISSNQFILSTSLEILSTRGLPPSLLKVHEASSKRVTREARQEQQML